MLFAVSLALVVSSVLGGAVPQQQTFQFQDANADTRYQLPTNQFNTQSNQFNTQPNQFNTQQFGGQTINGFQEDPWFEFVPITDQDSRFNQFPINVQQVSNFPPLSLQSFSQNPSNQQQTFNSQNTYSQYGTQQAQQSQFQFFPFNNQQQQQQFPQFGTPQQFSNNNFNNNNYNNNNQQQPGQFGSQPFNTQSTSTCYMPFINVTIGALNVQTPNQNAFQQTMQVPRVPMYYILLMLNGEDRGTRFGMQQMQNNYGQNNGMFVTNVNNLQTGLSGAWIPMDRFQNPINMGLDQYLPNDGDSVTFVYFPVSARKVKDDKKVEEKVVE